MSRLTEAQKMDVYYSIYEQLLVDERISLAAMSKSVGLARNTVTSHFDYMLRAEIIRPPSMRLRMFEDLREYAYFLKFDRPLRVFQELSQHPNVIYCCLASGAFDMAVIANAPLDIENHPQLRKSLVHGMRGDYLVSHVPRTTYEEAFSRIKRVLEEDNLERSRIPMDFPKQEIVWTDLEWRLFYDLKYDMRRTFTDIVKKHKISKWLFYQCYEHIKKNCVKVIPFYPHRRPNYTDLYFALETDYEKQLVDLLMQFPSSSLFFKVDTCVTGWINVIRTFSFKDVFGLFHWMDDHGITKNIAYAFPVDTHRKR